MDKQITRKNYEIYFLDYLEGELDIAMHLEFQKFLIDNPDLKAELDEMSDNNITLTPKNINFEAKEELKESVSAFGDLSFEEMAIARMEGELSAKESENFDTYLETHPVGKKEYLLFLKTRLNADLNITFENKSSLKRFAIFGFNSKQVLSLISVAASVILILSIFIFSSKYFIREQRQYSVRSVNSTTIDNNKEKLKDNDFIQLAGIAKQTKAVKNNTGLKVKAGNSQHPSVKTSLIKNIKREQLASLKKLTQKKAQIPVSDSGFRNSISAVAQINSEKKIIPKENIQDDYLSPKQFFTVLFKKEVLKEDSKDIDPNRISFLDIAEASINGLSKITGSKMRFNKEYDQDGELIAYGFSSSLLSFEKPYKRNQ